MKAFLTLPAAAVLFAAPAHAADAEKSAWWNPAWTQRQPLTLDTADLAAAPGSATEPADVLLLDEPLNHVSLALVEELETALAHHPGAVVVVTHDRRFQQRWRGDVLHLPGLTSAGDARR